jgi:tRNA-dihydrouridine synthase A
VSKAIGIKPGDWRFCVAPMMQYTDRHYRYLARRLSVHARLYTEMVVASALVRGDARHLLAWDTFEHPVALQLGGSDPRELALAARMGEDFGYAEINLNVGCPSDRVQAGRFGACLIAEPGLVAECVAAMSDAVQLPVTVKTRLGVDALDNQLHLESLVSQVAAAGCAVLILHARKALLNFSPRANREIPPLQYERVYAIKQAFPALPVVINGGIQSLTECSRHLAEVEGVMLGRAAYADLDLLARVDEVLFAAAPKPFSEAGLIESLGDYVARRVAEGVPLRHITKHWAGLRQGRPGARAWRHWLGTHLTRDGAGAAPFIAEAARLLRALEDPSTGEEAPTLRAS